MRAVASQAIRRGSIPEGEEGKLREQFDRVAVLYQRVSPGGLTTDDSDMHACKVTVRTRAFREVVP